MALAEAQKTKPPEAYSSECQSYLSELQFCLEESEVSVWKHRLSVWASLDLQAAALLTGFHASLLALGFLPGSL